MNRTIPMLAWLTVVLLGVSVLFNGFFVFQQVMVYRELQHLNMQLAAVPQIQGIVQNLVNDLGAYGQKQPEIFNILRKYGVGAAPVAPSLPSVTPKPAAPIHK